MSAPDLGSPVLVLFDLDLTLVSTHAAGYDAMLRAGRELHGPSFTAEGVPFAGRLDPLIIADLLRANSLPAEQGMAAHFREAYARHLAQRLAEGPAPTVLPGVHALLDALSRDDRALLGLLTGNFEPTGRIKLSASGLDADTFAVRVWGDDSPHDPPAREHLPPIALDRARRLGHQARPERAVVIGDTPHDVACARAHGCRSLGVATGRSSRDELARSGATRAVADLADTRDIVAWLLNSP